MMILVIVIIFLALLFDFINGMNDAANSVATIVSTRVLSPRQAVLWAAFFNFAAAFLFGVHVANTIGKGIIDTKIVSAPMILATLIGAIIWSYVCTHMGFPISVSHALVGGLVGAALAKSGIKALIVFGIAENILIHCPGAVDRSDSRLPVHDPGHVDLPQAIAADGGSLVPPPAAPVGRPVQHRPRHQRCPENHGHHRHAAVFHRPPGSTFYVPFWVIISCYLAISLGTLSGGWKVIETLGMKMTKLKPVHGFSAETAAAASILFSTFLGIPVSTTHTITGAIIGVGATSRLSAIRWGLAYRIVWAWILTIPGSALISALCWYGISLLHLPG